MNMDPTSASAGTPAAEWAIDAALVAGLLAEQHPDLADLPLREVDAGWDNALFRLGDDLAVRLPRRAVYPVAWISEWWAGLRGGPEPQVTVDALRMAAKKMYFDCARARAELGYTSRPARAAIIDALLWFRAQGMLN